jgi:putative methionine-R-sulfoxide reductase with GAF domain
MIIKEMFHIPMKLKSKLARAFRCLRHNTTRLVWFGFMMLNRASLKMYFGQRFHTPIKLQKSSYPNETSKECIVEARASSDLSFIGM